MTNKIRATCQKCGGKGEIAAYRGIAGGMCFSCNGAGFRMVTDAAIKATAKRRAKAAELRALRERIALEVRAELDAKLGPFENTPAGDYKRAVACQREYGKTPGDIVQERIRNWPGTAI